MNELTISHFHSAILSGSTTCEALISYYLSRIAKYDRTLRSIIAINPQALEEARRKDARFSATKAFATDPDDPNVQLKLHLPPLYGVPVVLKDTYATTSMPTTAGSISLRTLRTTEDAFVVQRLRNAGAIILAKANLHEFSLQGITISSLGGQTLNPYDSTRTPGGSSGGTAVALAANMALVGCGGDTMNSLRSPASACGVVGFRPSRGQISKRGTVPVTMTQDVVGPMARTVKDVRILFDVMRGQDAQDPVTVDERRKHGTTSPPPPSSGPETSSINALRRYNRMGIARVAGSRPPFNLQRVRDKLACTSSRAGGITSPDTNSGGRCSSTKGSSTDTLGGDTLPAVKIRIGVLDNYFDNDDTNNDQEVSIVNETIRSALEKSHDFADLIHLSVPEFDTQTLLSRVDVQSYEFRTAIDSFLQSDIVIPGSTHRSLASIAASGEFMREAMTAPFFESLQTDVFNTSSPEYKKRLGRIEALKQKLQECFEKNRLDALVYPHQRRLVVRVGETVQSGRNGILAALTGTPAVCVPAGFSSPTETAPFGIPIGIELLGRPWKDSELLNIAERFEGVLKARREPVLETV
ncbi:hypothetical protein DTO271G3_4491 [Paecilomyces variotii]|nr:hypothetical protein DTO271G3_4491 [Paecilomyces variotii]